MSYRGTWPRLIKGFPLWRVARKSAAPCYMPYASYCRFLDHQRSCYAACCLNYNYIRQRSITRRRAWFFNFSQSRQRLGLHTSSLYLNTSSSRWSASLNQQMSRVRSRLDTVSKAVSGTPSQLFSKIGRLKPKVLKTEKKATVESTAKVDEPAGTPTLSAHDVTSLSPATKTTFDSNGPTSPVHTSAAPTSKASATASTHFLNPSSLAESATTLTARDPENKNQVKRQVPPVKASPGKKTVELKSLPNDTTSKNTFKKQTPALFHPNTLSVSLDETYNYLAHHINSYFSVNTNTLPKKVDKDDNLTSGVGAQASSITPVSDNTDPAAAVSTKKGFGHYLSHSAPTVQAFVGSYISPLVPKFRTSESKSSVVAEKKLDDSPAKQVEATITTEQRVAEEKAKRLLLQQEKVSQQKVMFGFVHLTFWSSLQCIWAFTELFFFLLKYWIEFKAF